MKKLIIGAVAVVIVLGGAAFGFASRASSAATVEVRAVSPAQAKAAQVVAEGKVVPVRSVSLSPAAAGRVAEVLVKEGDRVEANQVILRLDSARQAAALAQATAGVAGAQARLQELKSGARPQEAASAQAVLDAAQAQLARVQQGARTEDIRAAEANLAAAQAALAKLQEGTASGQLIAARTEALNAAAVLQQAQAAYDKVKGNPDVAAMPQAVQLQQATNAYEAAKARLADLEAGASHADVAGAQARVRQAQAQLDALRSVARPAEVAAAEAEVRRAAAQLSLTKEGARTMVIDAAEADVAVAQAALDQAAAALAETELKAPFAGVIAEIAVLPGEQAGPGATVVTLADFSSWLIETTDLTELNVGKVHPGDRVAITLDAVPGLDLPGEVLRIRPVGKDQRGDITYTVVVQPLQADPRLKWNMTAALAINTK